jgi:nucleotide-binding universal stress UspA family protein
MYAKILVPVDGSDTSVLGLNEAIKIAKAHGSQLCLFHIVNEFVFDYTLSPDLYSDRVLDSLRLRGKETLDQMAALARQQDLQPECVLVESIGGSAGNLIIEQADKWGADLIVMGTHGRRGMRRLALGSDAEEVLRSTTIPVLFVRSAAAPANKVQNQSAA